MISLVGLDRRDVLAALYNASKPQGMGFMHYNPTPMTREEAGALLQRATYFDYLKGRVMKVDLSKDELDPRGYDRDNGPGAAERAIATLRETGNANASTIQAAHHVNTLESADHVLGRIEEGRRTTTRIVREGVVDVHMGYADVAEHLKPAVHRAVEARRK